MGKKLVLFDVDGTIISNQGVLPESAVSAIRKVRENGNYAVYFTGRPYAHVDQRVREIGFDGCICTMGAYVEFDGKVISDVKPDPQSAHEIIQAARLCNLDATYESDRGIQFDETRPLPEDLKNLKEEFSARGFETDLDIDDPDFSFEKVCVHVNEKSDLQKFENIAGNFMDSAGKKRNMEEFIAKGVSLQKGVLSILNLLKIDREDCYGIGDSINDMPALQCTSHSIAMGEASDEMKQQVEFVTKGLLEDGLAFAMKHYDLI